eukprot:m.52558 g.52558  ORF g.52558 m.52558 type:complete len:83 (+) comp11314_c0_seq1:69-317(+)
MQLVTASPVLALILLRGCFACDTVLHKPSTETSMLMTNCVHGLAHSLCPSVVSRWCLLVTRSPSQLNDSRYLAKSFVNLCLV